jgi:hypothetical protein
MANTIRIKRRSSGDAGAPSSLANAELAFNEVDDILYYGEGTGGAGGTASNILAIAGPGAFINLTGTQTITGDKTFSGTIVLGSSASATTPSVDDNTTKVATTAFVLGQANSINSTITMNGTQAAGTSLRYARADHVHPSDTSKANLDSPTFTGTPAAPTASTDTNTTQLATTAFVIGQASSTAPNALGTAATGTSLRYARADHVHVMPRLDQVTNPTTAVSLNNQKITNLADPIDAQDAATKAYVDAARSGLDVKESVRLASTGNISITYNATGGTSSRGQITAAPNTLDGVNLAAGDRILLKDQSAGAQNGIWVVTTLGTGANGVWDRATDFDSDTEVTAGAFTFVTEGATNADSGWVLTTNDAITIGGASGTALSFAQFSGAGQITAGAGLTKTGNTLDVGAGTGITVDANSVGLTGQALALHNLATNGLFTRTGTDTITARSIAVSGSGINVSNGNGVAGNPTLALSDALSSVGGLTPVADRIAYYTGASTAALATLTSFGRSLIDDADATAGRTTLGLGTISTQNANNVSITGGTIDNIVFDGGTF